LREYVDDEVKARIETDLKIQQLEMDLETVYEEIHTTFLQHGIIEEDDDYGYAKYNQKNYTDLMNANKDVESILDLAEKLQEHLKFRKVRRRCERFVGTEFQLPNPDAIYSRDEGKERRLLPSLVVCVRARSTCC
jgi:hypothetical protein